MVFFLRKPRLLAAMAGIGAILLMGFSLPGQPPHPRGVMVDIGGRRLRLVCEGPADAPGPVVLFEAGAFGYAGDWANVQGPLTAQGVRSCAYDRAGMGFSDPGPQPRDGLHVAQDLEKLLAAAKVPGPYVLVGHSMAGARVHLFANRNREKVAGLVLVDCTPPGAMNDPEVRRYVAAFIKGTHAAAIASSFGILKVLSVTALGDKLNLPPVEDAEKRWQFGSARYNWTAYNEALNWPLAARQALQTGPLDPDWPVAVVAAGDVKDQGRAMLQVQFAPARASKHGSITVVAGADHHALLGARYAGEIVKAIDVVLEAARRDR
jgi:pimeloyl-ACP methyl ester carboxylesterase